MIRYQTDDEGVVSQPEYTLTKPSNGPNDRDHLTPRTHGDQPYLLPVDAHVEEIAPHGRGGPRLSDRAKRGRLGAPHGRGSTLGQIQQNKG